MATATDDPKLYSLFNDGDGWLPKGDRAYMSLVTIRAFDGLFVYYSAFGERGEGIDSRMPVADFLAQYER